MTRPLHYVVIPTHEPDPCDAGRTLADVNRTARRIPWIVAAIIALCGLIGCALRWVL